MQKQLLKQLCAEYYTELLWYKQKGFLYADRKNLGLIKANSKGVYSICQVGGSDLVTAEMVMGKCWHRVIAGALK